MTDASGDGARRPHQRLTPDRARTISFSRSPIGRRGFSEDEVVQFQQRVADEIAARDASEASLRAKVTHYKNTLVQWQREHSEARTDDLPVPAHATPRPSVEAINILSQAQQEADAYVAQTQEYCRRLAADAQQHAEEIVARAHAEADAAAAGAALNYRKRAGEGYTADVEDLERRLVWARTFLGSLETVETQLRAAREALSFEFERISPGRG